MAARGLLVNPGMFAGYASTPRACVGDYVASALHFGSRFEVFSKTLEWMLCELLNKTDRMQLNACVSVAGIVDFLQSRDLPLTPSPRLLPL
jgi:tRNA-dihydrouridine synthase 4